MAALAILATLLSGLHGVVSRGPTQPVCLVGEPCTAPYAHAVLVFSRPGMTARKATADANGKYRITLAPGTWSLRVQGAQFGWTPRRVAVPAGRYGQVNVSVDTGMR